MINYKTVNYLGHLGQVLSFLCLPQSSMTSLGIVYHINHKECFLHNSVSKESACNARDPHSIPGPGRSLEKEMVMHSSILAWEIPWIEESGRLQAMG